MQVHSTKKAHSNEGVNWEKNTEFFFLWINKLYCKNCRDKCI